MGPFRCRSARSHGIGRHPSFGHSKYDIQEGPCLVASTCAVMVQAHVNDERQGDLWRHGLGFHQLPDAGRRPRLGRFSQKKP